MLTFTEVHDKYRRGGRVAYLGIYTGFDVSREGID